eukprot:729542-Prymnesium_polylepis.1
MCIRDRDHVAVGVLGLGAHVAARRLETRLLDRVVHLVATWSTWSRGVDVVTWWSRGGHVAVTWRPRRVTWW